MKLKHVGMIVVSVLAMSSAAVSAAEGDESVTTTVNGGVIHFKGEVVNAACAIDSESMNQTVELGQVRSSRLAKAGDLSSAVGFNIKLNDCDTNVSSNAAVAFLGTTVTSNDDTLALQSSAAGSAQNVGIEILDRTGEVLILDGATFSAKTDLIDVLVPFLSISRRPIRHLQMAPVTVGNRLNPSTANPSTRQEPISRSQDIAILRKVFITYPTVPTVE